MRPRGPAIFTTVVFLAVILSAGMIQTAWELRQGDRPQSLDVFRQAPSAANLRRYERSLEDASLLAGRLRPWAQYAQFRWCADLGEKGFAGRDGWLFYRPGLQYMTQRDDGRAGADDPVRAIRAFRDALSERGVHLLVVPAPNKESIYPEMVTAQAQGVSVMLCRRTRDVLDRLQGSGVEVVDLFQVFARAKLDHSPSSLHPLYLPQDTHWSPTGVRIAAQAVAGRLRDLGWVEPGTTTYVERSILVRRVGDVLQMLQVPQIESTVPPQEVYAAQVVRRDSGELYRDDPLARVLVLGDSFLRIYERDQPGAAGLVAHLAEQLKQPLASIISDGGASTLVRQELHRRPRLLENKTVVVWEFVERDIRDGTEGWQIVPLPPNPSSSP